MGRKLNKAFYSRCGRREWNPDGIDIFDEDWDNLIILDALRYDAMADAIDRHDISQTLDSRISRGSQTPEWLYANFDRQLHDVVYVTASAMPHHLGVETPQNARQRQYGFDLDVHKLINVWQDPPDNAIDTFVDRDAVDVVVPAEGMIQPALQAANDYPQKRIIAHLVPPHDPYWGETGQQLHQAASSPWHAKLRGDIDTPAEKLRKAYHENVDLAVEAAIQIAEQMPGKTVISSDHGEYLYERAHPIPVREILHPNKIYTETLVKVPWVEFDDDRREIVSEPPVKETGTKPNGKESREQLEALGYL